MTYEITLISADIRDPMDGEMRLGLKHDDAIVAEVDYRWDAKQFTAVFHGHAPTLPVPAHPTLFLERPIAAVRALKTPAHRFPSDVFVDNRVFITIEPEG
jgi:hypothetical protein